VCACVGCVRVCDSIVDGIAPPALTRDNVQQCKYSSIRECVPWHACACLSVACVRADGIAPPPVNSKIGDQCKCARCCVVDV
jgi:hypothetical protein